MTATQIVLLVGSAFVGGALNAVAGGGSFATFPALVWTGLGPVAANATSSVAIWPAQFGSSVAYRRQLGGAGLRSMAAVSVLGGGIGAWLVVVSGDVVFARLVPWLLGTATLLFALAPVLKPKSDKALPWPAVLALQFAIAIYGGYFGGGMGILMLAVYTLAGIRDVHEANARKALMGLLLNAMAIMLFVAAGSVRWPQAAVMSVGALAGGYLGARWAMRVSVQRVRVFVVGVGAVMTVLFAVRS
jgi:uncharacterized membrane protein YfcA